MEDIILDRRGRQVTEEISIVDQTRFTRLLALEEKQPRQWAALAQARAAAMEVTAQIQNAIKSEVDLVSSDATVVLYGSLARGEWTTGSDVDWALLVDGQSDPDHHECLQAIPSALLSIQYRGQALGPPGSSGTFGQLVFSHDLVHSVGGESDTNQNTTRRILLLLESIALDEPNGAYRRTLRSILRRYLLDDVRIASQAENSPRIPRFLLNDIVRFWRTLCVDFGTKHWQQSGKKWAVRNIKLRTSRKLLFVSGLLTAFSCDRIEGGPSAGVEEMLARLTEYAELPPLEIIARELTDLGLEKQAVDLFTLYDTFLARLNDKDKRQALESVQPQHAYQDPVFSEFRDLSHELQEILTNIFFDSQSRLRHLTLKYGVF